MPIRSGLNISGCYSQHECESRDILGFDPSFMQMVEKFTLLKDKSIMTNCWHNINPDTFDPYGRFSPGNKFSTENNLLKSVSIKFLHEIRK